MAETYRGSGLESFTSNRSGLPIDSKTPSLLCVRPYSSPQLVRNIARLSAAPAALIAHLLRQEGGAAAADAALKRHPNAPVDPVAPPSFQ